MSGSLHERVNTVCNEAYVGVPVTPARMVGPEVFLLTTAGQEQSTIPPVLELPQSCSPQSLALIELPRINSDAKMSIAVALYL